MYISKGVINRDVVTLFDILVVHKNVLSVKDSFKT